MDAATGLFPWWSFTKTVIAICALRLVEENRLDLHAALTGRPYSLHQLAQHRSGLPDYCRLAAYRDAVARGDKAWPRENLLALANADRLVFAPGAGWGYSNIGYLRIRALIEEATGCGLDQVIAELVAGPLRLASVRLAMNPGDFDGIEWPAAKSYDPRWVYHGCLLGTPDDAVRLLASLCAGLLLRPDTLALMQAVHPLGGARAERPWTQTGYGLGLMSGAMGEAGRAIGHSGGGPFNVAAVYHFPDAEEPCTVACFAQGTDESPAEFEAARLSRLSPSKG